MTNFAELSDDTRAINGMGKRGTSLTLRATDGACFEAYLAPPPLGRGPGLILLGGDGLCRSIRHHADRFAAEGYAVVAPDLSRHKSSGDDRRAALRDGVADVFVARACLAPYLEASAKIGLLAFDTRACYGWQLAAQQAIDALVIHGGADLDLAAELAPEISCPVALHLAAADILGASDILPTLRASVAKPSLFRLHEYAGGNPGLLDTENAAYDPHANAVAHSRSLAVLRLALGPHYDLAGLFQEHLRQEFVLHDPDATMATMVDAPYVNHVPTLTGGVGHDVLKRFYKYHFIPKLSKDRDTVLISETIGSDTVVLEMVSSFTHNEEVDYFLPGVPPTGKRVEIPVVVIAKFRGDKLYHEHIYWDQASVLAQLGLIDPTGLPVAGVDEARKMLDQTRPANELMARWSESEGKPI